MLHYFPNLSHFSPSKAPIVSAIKLREYIRKGYGCGKVVGRWADAAGRFEDISYWKQGVSLLEVTGLLLVATVGFRSGVLIYPCVIAFLLLYDCFSRSIIWVRNIHEGALHTANTEGQKEWLGLPYFHKWLTVCLGATVDGRDAAPPGMYKTL